VTRTDLKSRLQSCV
jgi:hypothetical protein